VYISGIDGSLVNTIFHQSEYFVIYSLTYSPDGKYFIGAGENTQTYEGVSVIWETETLEMIAIISHKSKVSDIACSIDGRYIAFATLDKEIRIWDIKDSKFSHNLTGHKKTVTSVVFSRNNKYLFSGSKDKSIIQWDIESGVIARTFIGHEDPVTCINISPDGKYIVSGSPNGTIIVWDYATGSDITTIRHHKSEITSICFSPDGNYIISGSEDGTVKVIESVSGILERSLIGHHGQVNDVDITKDGRLIATACDDNTVKIWNSNIVLNDSVIAANERRTELMHSLSGPPEIIWSYPSSNYDTSSSKELQIHLNILSDSKLEKVQILHNSRVDDYDLKEYIDQADKTDLSIERIISLDEGNNSIIVIAGNSGGSTTSEVRSVLFESLSKTELTGINWITPEIEEIISTEENFTIKACIRSDTRIEQVSLLINNHLWTFDRTVNVDQASPECRIEFIKEIKLTEGNNEVRIEALTADSRTIKSTRNVRFYREEPDAEKRLALVIGNSEYEHGGFLLNPVNDATAMVGVLETVGFEVISYTNADQKTVKIAMDEFGERLEDFDVGLFYYAGHGIQVSGSNYIIPVDATLYKEQDVDYDCVEVGRILGKMEASASTTNIIILDACRDNPFERKWSGRSVKTRGLAFMNAPSGSIIAYATSPGRTASDGIGENGLYTGTLIKYLQVPGLQIEDVFKSVRSEVEDASDGLQTPWESTSLKGEFYFIR